MKNLYENEVRKDMKKIFTDDPIKSKLLEIIQSEDFRYLKNLEPILKVELHVAFLPEGDIARGGHRIRIELPYMNSSDAESLV